MKSRQSRTQNTYCRTYRGFIIILSFLLIVAADIFIQEDTAGATLPTLPQTYVDTTMPVVNGNTYTVNSGESFQNALNQAAAANPGLNHQIILQAGATFTGPFTLPARPAGSGWIIIRSSAEANLPLQGTRVLPADAANMPKIVIGAGKGAAITTASGARNFRFIGIEVTPTPGSFVYNLVTFGNGETSLDTLPHDLVFDRSYLHGDSAAGSRRGIALNAQGIAVIDSYLADFKEVGADSQALAGWAGPGPFKIVNNYLEGAGENIMFGGADPVITNVVPSDIEMRNNYIAKPLVWQSQTWSVKNLLEFKNAHRALVNGNVLENNWLNAQVGFAILFTPRNQNGTAPWSGVQDITFTNNIIRHTASGINILGQDDLHISQQTQRILIKNNLLDDVNRTKFGGDGRIFQIVTAGLPTVDLVIDHNTAFHVGGGNAFCVVGDTVVVAQNFVFTNDIVTRGDYGFFGSGIGEGTVSLNYYTPGYVFQKNVIIGNSNVAPYYPPDNFFPAAISDVGFVDYTSGDYHLSAVSPYKNAGTDGTDMGANIDALNAATSCAISGACGRGPSDTTPPAVTITSPVSDTTYTTPQSVSITVSASDNVGVAKVAFYDGTTLKAIVNSAPYTYNWSISNSDNGANSWSAIAYDAAGNSASSSPVVLNVNISGSDTTPPTVSILSPANNSTLPAKGTVKVSVSASDNVGVAKIELFFDGALQASSSGTTTLSYNLKVRNVSSGAHTISAKATDTSGNTQTASITVVK